MQLAPFHALLSTEHFEAILSDELQQFAVVAVGTGEEVTSRVFSVVLRPNKTQVLAFVYSHAHTVMFLLDFNPKF